MKSRVLIVEVDPSHQKLLEKTLLQNNLEILSTDNGPEAISLLRAHNDIKLIIADVRIPVQDNEFKQIKLTDPNLKEIPIILMTESLRLAETAKDLNPYVILTKPVNPSDLNKIVNNHFYQA